MSSNFLLYQDKKLFNFFLPKRSLNEIEYETIRM